MTATPSDGPSPVSIAAPGLMTTEMLIKVCSFASLTYLALVLYFLGAIHGWGFFSELPVKSTRQFHGPTAGLFGTLPCALAFLVVAWLMRHWNQRRSASETSLWNRFPVPLHAEIPSTDPVGKGYRILFFTLIFGVGAYAQGDLFLSFLDGKVYLSQPEHSTVNVIRESAPHVPCSGESTLCTAKSKDAEQPCKSLTQTEEDQRSDDPVIRDFARSKCGLVISTRREHFTHRVTGFFTNEYHFEQTSGLTYAPGYQPYGYLAATAAMAVMWLWCVGPWVLAAAQGVCNRFRRDRAVLSNASAAATSDADGEVGAGQKDPIMKYPASDKDMGTDDF